MKPCFQIWLTRETGLAVLNMIHSLSNKALSGAQCHLSQMNSVATIKRVLFFIHKKPFTRNVFQINARLYSVVTTVMAENVMKQTRLTKTITGILLHNTAPAQAAVFFETCFKKKRGYCNQTLPYPCTSRNKYVCMLCVDKLWDTLWLLHIT
jgi:hypothetical protein